MGLLRRTVLPQRASLRYVQVTRTSGDFSVTNTVPAALDGTGALDLVLPAAPGDLIEVVRNAQANNAAIVLDFNVRILTSAGATIRDLSPSAIGAWTVRGGDYFGSSAVASFAAQADDVPDGNLRLRLLAKVGSAGTRILFASTASVPFQWWAKNLGPVA